MTEQKPKINRKTELNSALDSGTESRDPQQIADDNISQYVVGQPELFQESREQDLMDTANLDKSDTRRSHENRPSRPTV